MPYFTGLDPLRDFLFRRRTPSVGTALRSAIPPLQSRGPDFERLGQLIQGLNFPKPSEEWAARGGPISGPAQLRAGEKLLESMLRSYGRTVEQVATPTGRETLAESLKKVATERPGLHTLQEPSVEAAFNISDFIPGLGFVGAGTKAVGKEALEKAGREGLERAGREAGEKGMLDVIGEGGVSAREKARLAQKRIEEATEALKEKRLRGKPMIETPLGMEIEKKTVRPMEEFLEPKIGEWPEDVAAEIENEVKGELYGKSIVPKEVAAPNSQAWSENWPEIRSMVSFLRSKGEETAKGTGMLYREHIPRGTEFFGKRLRSSEELASEIGWTEGDLMDVLNDYASQGARSKVTAKPTGAVSAKVPKPKKYQPKVTPEGLRYPQPGADLVWMDEVFDTSRSKDLKFSKSELAEFNEFKKKSYQDWMDELHEKVPLDDSPVPLIKKADQTKWVEGLEAATPDRGKPLFYLREYSSPDDFQDLSPILERRGLQTHRIVNKVGSKSPEIKNYLYETTIEPLYRNLSKSFDDQASWLNSLDEAKGSIRKGSKESNLALGYIEGTLTLDDLKRESPNSWQEIEKFADWSKESYSTLLDFLNKFRTQWGLDPIQPRENYVPHIFEMSSFLSTIRNAGDIKNLNKAPNVPVEPVSRFFRFGEPRLGAPGFKRDAVEAMEQYIKSAINHAYSLEPIVNLRGTAKILEDKGVPNAADALRTQADRVANTKDLPTLWAEGLVGAPMVRFLKNFSNRIADSWVGMNISTILLQPAGWVNATGRIGAANTVGGLQGMMTGSGRRFADRYSNVLKGRRQLPEIDPSVGQRITNVSGLPWQRLEELTVGSAFLGGVRDGLKKGLSLEDAIKWGDEVASTTQGEFRRGLREPVMSEAMGRIGLKFQSWAINTVGQLGYDIPQGIRQSAREGKGIGKIKNEGLLRAIEMVIGMAVANRIYRSTTGREPFSLGGIIPSGTFPLAEVAGPVGSLPDVLVGEMTPLEEAQWESRVKNSVISVLGALTRLPTTQMSKTARGLESISRGGSYTPKGRERFPVKGLDEQVRALLFGPWGTQAGQKYLRTDIFQTKKKPSKNADWLKGFER